ncbi:MAG: hypothetical protein RIA09_15970 [Hoeflea sp.]|jgi:hypothetical protein|uniref:hypothetical protein n=1 Tax=Hoeflea sp. TaxID=1940281 RepID=UPI0032EFE71D
MSNIFSEWFMQFGLLLLSCVFASTVLIEIISADGRKRLSSTYGNVLIGFASVAVALHMAPPRMTEREWIIAEYVMDCAFVNVVFFFTGLIILDIVQRINARLVLEHWPLAVMILFSFSTILGIAFSPEWPL